MTISLDKVGKRFNREWIFRNISFDFLQPASIAITGPNGSGKSTLMQVIAGNLLASTGKLIYKTDTAEVPDDQFYQYLAFSAPYLDVIEDFTLREFLKFHFKFKKLKKGVALRDLPEILQLEGAVNKQIKNFSTGMRQRVKLGICFYTEVPVILLDEPATNLDRRGVNWYLAEIEKVRNERLIFISSNVEQEYNFCDQVVNILDYK